MTVITGKDIWEKASKDPAVTKAIMFKSQMAVFQDYVENNLLDAIGDMMDKPATLENIINAKVAFVKNVLSTGLIRKFIEAEPARGSMIANSGVVIKMLESVLEQLVEALEPIAADMQKFLEENNLSEAFIYAKMGLSSDNIDKAAKGELTIGELILDQPAVILKMNDE